VLPDAPATRAGAGPHSGAGAAGGRSRGRYRGGGAGRRGCGAHGGGKCRGGDSGGRRLSYDRSIGSRGGRWGSNGSGRRDKSDGGAWSSSRRAARARASGSGIPNLGAWDGVAGERSVDVEDNAGVRVSVPGVEVEVLVGNGASGASDLDLNAAGVELSAAGGVGTEGIVGLVVGDDLLADQVLASGEVGRQGELLLASVGNQLVNSPETRGTVIALLSDLGPDGANAIGGCVGSNVGDDGTLVRAVDDVVAAGVVVPLEGQGVASSRLDKGRHFLATVDVAHEIRAGEILDRAVVGRGSDVDISAIALVDAVDEDAVHSRVGRGTAGKGQGEVCDRQTHHVGFGNELLREERVSVTCVVGIGGNVSNE